MSSTIHMELDEMTVVESASAVYDKLEKAELFGLTFVLLTETNDARDTREVVLDIEDIEKVEGSWN
jgi:hypothetical protein